jgi:hypothetical protein
MADPFLLPAPGRVLVSPKERQLVEDIMSQQLQSQGFSKGGAKDMAAGRPPTSAADKSRAGASAAVFPDVCKTPSPPGGPAPIPYPNLASASSGKGSAKKLMMSQKTVSTKKAELSKSTGNEPGTLKGLISNRYRRK